MGEFGDTYSHHVWYTPENCAAMLEGVKHGDHWRAQCPAHHGENRQSLIIREGRDRDGNPMTLLYCFAHQCSINDLCAAMGIDVRSLFCIHPEYARVTRSAARSRSPRIERLRRMDKVPPDELALIMLEDNIVNDPHWIDRCPPARVKMWELATASPHARERLTRALREARIIPAQFWAQLKTEVLVPNAP